LSQNARKSSAGMRNNKKSKIYAKTHAAIRSQLKKKGPDS
jgi:hypothetical protein